MIAYGHIIHVATPDDWLRDRHALFYEPDSLESEVFIHCCRRDQLRGVLGRHFAGHRALVLLVIDPRQLTSPLRVEESRPGDYYPYVYGPIDRVAVVSVFPIEADSTGSFTLPDGFD